MIKYTVIIAVLIIVLFLVFRDKRPVSASADITISAPIDQVWRLQTDISGWKNWNNDIENMQVDGKVGLGTSFTWKAGGITIVSKITEFVPKRKIAWQGKTIGISAYHTWEFAETENGVLVHTEEQFTGFLAWLLPGTMRSQIDKALNHGVSVLKSASEAKQF